jgi:SAM-dependent methyltransferase
MPSFEDLEEYYSKAYVFTDCDREFIQTNKPSPALRFIKSKFQDFGATKCLDVGAGNGRFLSELRDMGFNDLYAIEPNDSLVGFLVDSGFVVEKGMMSNDSFPELSFDVINAGDVIEHLIDPVEFIQTIQNKLNLGGVLIITTPNMYSLWSRFTYILYKYLSIPWSSLTPIAHVNNFSLASLRYLLNSNSFQIVDSYFGPPSLKYELGHTHLFRAFREKRSLKSLLSWVLGWSLYVIFFYPIRLLSKRRKADFKMTLIAQITSG